MRTVAPSGSSAVADRLSADAPAPAERTEIFIDGGVGGACGGIGPLLPGVAGAVASECANAAPVITAAGATMSAAKAALSAGVADNVAGGEDSVMEGEGAGLATAIVLGAGSRAESALAVAPGSLCAAECGGCDVTCGTALACACGTRCDGL
ncbi:hypothetical protein ABB27_07120 [Stenotrophomonas terrae]|uniref:Uncharacterized protein n=1 Tax=Stenotrophomonas terrae TaxID=405446 RepID=A0A0R0CFY2_9GAMM|nr:hypothetical protein ABB27_07120 [Stenotrophomonas terrae]